MLGPQLNEDCSHKSCQGPYKTRLLLWFTLEEISSTSVRNKPKHTGEEQAKDTGESQALLCLPSFLTKVWPELVMECPVK